MECKQRKTDCMYNHGTVCKILSDTRFERRCPFYRKGIDPYDVERVVEGHKGVFKKLCGYGDRFYVSDQGEVMVGGGLFLKPKLGYYNNLTVQLRWTYNGKPTATTKNVDSLVAEAFCLDGDGEIEHIDGDPTNCKLENLRRKGRKRNG